MSKQREDPKGALGTPFNNPFASLERLRSALPEGPAPTSKVKQRSGPARAVVRLERKGHGGKDVTVISHLDLGSDEWATWLKALKATLGCGGSAQNGEILLQGDQRDRVAAVLGDLGVRKVTMG